MARGVSRAVGAFAAPARAAAGGVPHGGGRRRQGEGGTGAVQQADKVLRGVQLPGHQGEGDRQPQDDGADGHRAAPADEIANLYAEPKWEAAKKTVESLIKS